MNLSVDKHFKPLSSDMMKILDHVETKFSPYKLQVKGAPLWPLLRIRWFFSEWARLYATQESATISGSRLARTWQQVSPWLRRVLDRRVLLPVKAEGHHHVDLVFFSDGISFTNLEGTWFERFCDPLIEQGKKLGLTSVLWTPTDLRQAVTKSVVFSFQPQIAIKTLMAAIWAKFTREDFAVDLKNISDEVQSMGYEATQFSPGKMVIDAYRVRMLSDMFHRRLVLTSPRLACIVNYYSLEGMAFVWACKRLGIPVVDLQHGVQGVCHPAYAGWKISDQNEDLPLVPGYFWVWSENEAQVIRRSINGTAHQPYVGGNPWVELWKADNATNPQIAELLKRGYTLKIRAEEKPVILITLQYGLSYSEQLEPLRALITLAHENYVFWVRLHPMMRNRRNEVNQYLHVYPIEIDEVSDLPLHALLPYCNIHITHSSSTVIEAADYGILSLITTAFGAELFPEQLRAGMAKLVEGGASEVYNTLQQLDLGKRFLPVVRPSSESSLSGLLSFIENTALGAKT